MLQLHKSWDKFIFWFLFWYLKLQRQLLCCFSVCTLRNNQFAYTHRRTCHVVSLLVFLLPVRKDGMFPSCLLLSSLQERSAPILYLGAGCGWGQNHQGWFCSLEFPHGCCVRLPSIAEEKCLSQQLLLLRTDFKWWTLLLWTQFHDIEMMHHDLITEPLLALLPFARSFLCHVCLQKKKMLCVSCCMLSFNLPWQIKCLLSHKCLC